jgi:hypothetical protein
MREPTPDQRAERQLRAAYRLILTWPSKQETRSTAEPGRDAIDRAGSITTTPERSGDTAGECNRS